MKILIADDHALFRDGLKRTITEKINSVIFGEAGSYSELLNILRKESWDVILLDLNMPGRSGFDALVEIKSLHPDIPVLVLSMFPEEQFATRVIRAGAVGYLTKGISPKELCEAINAASTGKQYFTKEVANVMASEIRSGEQKILDKLSAVNIRCF